MQDLRVNCRFADARANVSGSQSACNQRLSCTHQNAVTPFTWGLTSGEMRSVNGHLPIASAPAPAALHGTAGTAGRGSASAQAAVHAIASATRRSGCASAPASASASGSQCSSARLRAAHNSSPFNDDSNNDDGATHLSGPKLSGSGPETPLSAAAQGSQPFGQLNAAGNVPQPSAADTSGAHERAIMNASAMTAEADVNEQDDLAAHSHSLSKRMQQHDTEDDANPHDDAGLGSPSLSRAMSAAAHECASLLRATQRGSGMGLVWTTSREGSPRGSYSDLPAVEQAHMHRHVRPSGHGQRLAPHDSVCSGTLDDAGLLAAQTAAAHLVG